MLSWEERQVTTETAEDLNVKVAERLGLGLSKNKH